MMNWAKQTLANVAGTREPIYGPSAIQPVTKQAETTPYTELTKEELRWTVMDSTSVETQTFYLMADSGHIGMAQVIYSNVAGIKTTVQFNSKIIYPGQEKPNLWCSDPVEGYGFDPKKYSFHAQGCSVNLSEDGKSYVIKSKVNKQSVVDLKISQVAPGFVVGNDGTSFYGTDPKKPWGRMRHAFWPRCTVEGSMITASGPVDFKGKALFIHALQGMKPHHAAGKWDFVNFQSPSYSAVMMQYETPASYGSTVVNVGGVVKEDKILFAGASNTAQHTHIKGDKETEWPEPSSVKFTWADSKSSQQAILEGPYGDRIDRIDVMAQVPAFVKQIIAGAAGTKPYIYQYSPKLTIKVKSANGEEAQEEGAIFSEVTFISSD